MVRNGRLIDRQRFGELANADVIRTGGQRREHRQPIGIGDRLEQRGRAIQIIGLYRHISILGTASKVVNMSRKTKPWCRGLN